MSLKLKVLSLFDGLSGAQTALQKLGVAAEYYASEIDEYAMKITKKNFPETIQLGDILQFFTDPADVINCPMQNLHRLPKDIDLLIAGFPCQGLSVANNNGKGLEDPRSFLFYAFLRILDHYCKTQKKPFYFVGENVESMKTKDFVIITNKLGVEPIMLDAGLVSAQRRKRYFWTNIPGVKKPKDKGLVIADILEPNAQRRVVNIAPEKIIQTSYGVRWNQTSGQQRQHAISDDKKAASLDANIWKTLPRIVKSHYHGIQGRQAINIENKFSPIDTNVGKRPACIIKPSGTQGQSARSISEKSDPITTAVSKNKALIVTKETNHQQDRAVTITNKHGSLTASRTTSRTIFVLDDYRIEQLTWTEIERLAGLPDGYTDLGAENRTEHRGRAIGNGFQIDIVAHLLSYALNKCAPIERSKQRIKGEQVSLFGELAV